MKLPPPSRTPVVIKAVHSNSHRSGQTVAPPPGLQQRHKIIQTKEISKTLKCMQTGRIHLACIFASSIVLLQTTVCERPPILSQKMRPRTRLAFRPDLLVSFLISVHLYNYFTAAQHLSSPPTNVTPPRSVTSSTCDA